MNYLVAILIIAVVVMFAFAEYGRRLAVEWKKRHDEIEIKVASLELGIHTYKERCEALEFHNKRLLAPVIPPMPVNPKWTALERRNLREFFAQGTGQKFIEASRHKIYIAAIEATKDAFHTAHSSGMVAGADNLLLSQLGMAVDEKPISQPPQAQEGEFAGVPETNDSAIPGRRSFT